jgi:polyhydroxyalkanoate synthesis regulator phasin
LKEEADKRRALETELRKMQALNSALLQHSAQSRQQPKATPPDPGSDSEQAFLDSVFGTDDTGKKIQQAVSVAVKRALSRDQPQRPGGEPVTAAQVQQMVQAAVGGMRGQLMGSTRMVNRINTLIQRGILSETEGQQVQSDVLQRLQEPGVAQAAQNPAQLDYLVSDAIARQLESETPPAAVTPRPAMPIQPGSNGHSSAPAEPEFNPAESPFTSLRDLSSEASERLTRLSQQRNRGGR